MLVDGLVSQTGYVKPMNVVSATVSTRDSCSLADAKVHLPTLQKEILHHLTS